MFVVRRRQAIWLFGVGCACAPAGAPRSHPPVARVEVPEARGAPSTQTSEAQAPEREEGVRVIETPPPPTELPPLPPSIPAEEGVSGLAVSSQSTRSATVSCGRCWMWPATHVSGLPLAFVEQRDGVSPVQAERLVIAADGTARLSILYAWVDPSTLGTRLIRSFEIELTSVSTSGSATGVYAYRIDDEVIVLVATPEVWEYVLDGDPETGRWRNTNCDHMRFELTPDPGRWTLPIKLRKREQPAMRLRIRTKRVGDDMIVRVD